LFATETEKGRAGVGRKPKTLPLINTDDTDGKKPNPQENTAEGGGATRVIPGLICVTLLES
jgi:hypothetical protein